MTELRKLKHIRDLLNPMLVVDASFSTGQIYEIIEMYQKVRYNSVILTKMDRQKVFGNIFNFAKRQTRPSTTHVTARFRSMSRALALAGVARSWRAPCTRLA